MTPYSETHRLNRKWLLVPVAGLALAATVVQTIRRRARQPRVRRMSDQWLREHETARAEQV
jgi:hypothetical protein